MHGLKSNYLIRKLSLWTVVFPRSYRPEGQGKGSLNSGVRRINKKIRPSGTTYLKTFVPIISQRRRQCNVLAGVQIYGLRTRREEI